MVGYRIKSFLIAQSLSDREGLRSQQFHPRQLPCAGADCLVVALKRCVDRAAKGAGHRLGLWRGGGRIRRFVWITIAYVNRGFHATAITPNSRLLHNPG
jgi:hypothetical protein